MSIAEFLSVILIFIALALALLSVTIFHSTPWMSRLMFIAIFPAATAAYIKIKQSRKNSR